MRKKDRKEQAMTKRRQEGTTKGHKTTEKTVNNRKNKRRQARDRK